MREAEAKARKRPSILFEVDLPGLHRRLSRLGPIPDLQRKSVSKSLCFLVIPDEAVQEREQLWPLR